MQLHDNTDHFCLYLRSTLDGRIMNTFGILLMLTPVVITTLFTHIFHRKSNRNKQTSLSYEEGLRVIRKFLQHTSNYTVEELQALTVRHVHPSRHFHAETVVIPENYLSSAASAVIDQLGPKGIERIGGKKWWQWRGPEGDLKAEWIETRKTREQRMADDNARGNKVIHYIHGGAYFFGSVDTHRPQLQIYARMLKAQVFATQYRLAPQFPFPCALQDCLASYLFLLDIYDPSEIVFAGDSAGGGLVLSLLCTLRDRGLPLPAGGILISAWVDLTHSFPSVAENTALDYLPPTGFRNKPSRAWPPPNGDELSAMKEEARKKRAAIGSEPEKETSDFEDVEIDRAKANTLSFIVNGRMALVKDQIQLYTPNNMMAHPLVSPIAQPSLGGLPPLFVVCGGGEMLRDEQIYIAHKAANPQIYPPSDSLLDECDPERRLLKKYKPTYVQLQVWEGACHALPTFVWARPAKHMFRAITQFGAWALSRAQNSTPIDVLQDCNNNGYGNGTTDNIYSSGGNDNPADSNAGGSKTNKHLTVGKAGDPLPPFRRYMIRQKVDENGRIAPLERSIILPILERPASKLCQTNPDLVEKWLSVEEPFNRKFAKARRRVRKQIVDEMVHGSYGRFEDEFPPLTALAARKPTFEAPLPQRRTQKNCGLLLWNSLTNRNDGSSSEDLDSLQKVFNDSSQASERD